MAKQVRNEDIFQQGLFSKTVEEAKQLIVVLNQLETEFKDVAVAQKEIINNQDNKTIQSVQRTKNAVAELNEVQKQALKVEQQKKKLTDSLTLANSKQNKQIQELRVQIQLQNKATKQLTLENSKVVGSYAALSARLNRIRKEYKNVAISEGEASVNATKLRQEVLKLDAQLKRVDKSAGQSQRSVGAYGNAFNRAGNSLRSFAGALGITAGIAGLVRTMTKAIKIARDFEQGNANLAAILGKNRKEITALTDDAKRLGSVTAFSATQVSTLQTEFAKLGFNEKEILNATESTLNLAAATGSELGEAAAIAGATLGGFGLDASKTTKVTDVMAKAFSSSALDLEKFKESMKDAAPAARAVGVDVEKTTALLGTLANAGISGSKAGNALKAGFIELNAAGVSLDDALVKIQKSNNKLATATQLVGRRAATSFLVLSSGVKTTNELEKSLRNAGGAAEAMAKEQLDTLNGRVKIFSSAWEGLVLSLLDGESAFSSVANTVVELATNFVSFLTVTERLSDQLQQQADSLLTMTVALNDVNTNSSKRLEIIQDLNKNYPALLKNLGFETVGLNNVNEALQAVNKNMSERVNIQQAVEDVTDANNAATSIAEVKQKSINKFIFEGTKNLQENGLAHLLVNKTLDEQIQIIDENQTFWQSLKNEVGNVTSANNLLNITTEENTEILAENKEFIESVLKSKKDLENLTTEELRALAKSNILRGEDLQQQAKEIIILRERQAVTEEETEAIEQNTEAKGKNIKKTRELEGLIEKQAKVVSDLQEQLKRATSEEEVFSISFDIKFEGQELERIKRIASSTIEEINKIETDLIEDQTEKRIAKEKEKSAKIIEIIQTNSKISQAKREELILQETQRLERFTSNAELKAGQKRIKDAEVVSKAEFEQRRKGFNDEEEFEKEKAKQFEAIRKQSIEAEIALIEQLGGDGSQVRLQQLKAELEGLGEVGKGFKKLEFDIGDAVQVIGELIDESFEKRIEAIGEAIDKTGENVDRLREKAAQGQLSSEESIAFEQKKEAELEQQRERERKRQQRTQAFFAVLSSFQANDGNLAKTITDIGVLRALANGFSAFDGVDDTGGRGTVDSKGGRLWTLHPHEQVYSKEDRKALGFRTREEVKDIVKMYDSGTLNDLMVHDASNQFLNPSSFVLNGMDTSAMENKLDKLNHSINNIKMPSKDFTFDEVKGLITMRERVGNKVVKTKSKLRGL